MSGYTPNKWVDREGTTRYFETIDTDGAKIFTPDYTQVTEMGTPVNEDNMNHIEEGIAAGSFSKYDSMTTYEKDDLVTAIIDNELKVYKSLQDNNNGNTLTDTTFWEEVEFAGGGAGLQLFDLIEKDHILTYEESKGLALLGTYVYKEAVAGSRYGYPDFYAKCLEEYESSVVETPNLNITGSLTCVNGVLSGFSSSAYAKMKAYYTGTINSLEWVMCATIPTTTPASIQTIIGQSATNYATPQFQILTDNRVQIIVSTDGSTWDVNLGDNYVGTAGKKYWLKLVYNNTTGYEFHASENGVTYTLIESSTTTTAPKWSEVAEIGADIATASSAFGGSIDLNESYININGERWWNGGLTYKNSNGHIFYDIADKGAVDAFYETYGVAWYYGVDTENERVFLPRSKSWQINVKDISVAGNGQAVKFTNGSNERFISVGANNTNNVTNTNCLYFSNSGSSSPAVGSGANLLSNGSVGVNSLYGVTTDGDTSGLIANTSELFTEKENHYLYMCVGNTEVSEAVTGITEVTTTENDTIPLGYSVYQANGQPSVSWLKSEGQWNDGNIYATFYNEFVQKIGQAFAGGFVKEITDEYDDYDLVINQDDMTFRLPLYDGSEDLPSDKKETLILNSSGATYTASHNGWVHFNYRSSAAGQYTNMTNTTTGFSTGSAVAYSTNNIECPVTLPVNKGDIYQVNYTTNGTFVNFKLHYAQGNGSLYFKVANAVQNLELLNAGEVLEAVNNVVPNNRELIASYGNPDYSAMVTTSTAPADGYFIVYTMVVQANTNVNFFINDVEVAGIDWVTSNTAYRNGGWMFRCSKGDVFSYTNSSGTISGITVNFVPLKGAN